MWDLEEFAPPGLESALATAARMVEVLRGQELLEPGSLKWSWFVFGVGGIGVNTELSLLGRALDDEDLSGHILRCRPEGFPDAEVGDIFVSGTGVWLDARGQRHKEHGLVELSVSPDAIGLSAEVAVYHDIWGDFDFSGRPHPEVKERNAPRLAAALQALDSMLAVPAEPGEQTYFGRAEGHGLQVPDVIDGLGPDLTDLM
ncbi:hypothetical protein ABZY03_26870 [Streptomyces klenkii]|uniref:hypothetical protein n=1 Tax=Streptomyces klenkii TaxID=1420899 RepID=UPI0033BBE0E1